MEEMLLIKVSKSLAASILLKSLADLKAALIDQRHGEQKEDYNLKELQEFFNSDWFEELCEMVRLKPNDLREKINKIRRNFARIKKV